MKKKGEAQRIRETAMRLHFFFFPGKVQLFDSHLLSLNYPNFLLLLVWWCLQSSSSAFSDSESDGDDSDQWKDEMAQDEDDSGGGEAKESGKEDEDDDAELARRLDREMNGLRSRPRRTTQYNISHPEVEHKSRGRKGSSKKRKRNLHKAGSSGRKMSSSSRGSISRNTSSEIEADYIPVHNRNTRSNAFSINKISYKEDDEDDELLYEDDDLEKMSAIKQRQKEQSAPKAPALLTSDDALDDTAYDIERVIDHKWEGDEEFKRLFLYIKWQRRAYIYCSWEPDESLQLLTGYKRVSNYMRKVKEADARKAYLSPEEIEQLDVEKEMELQLVSQHKQIDRIVEEDETEVNGSCYLIKWDGLPYSECTWETVDVIDRCLAHKVLDKFQDYQQRGRETGSAVEARRSNLLQNLRRQGGKLFTSQPKYIKGTLRAYQLDGLNYLAACWARNSNCILADEMGLGKTIQCVTMLNFLFEEMNLTGPFLVVVPLSTVPNWKKEFNIWAPGLNTIVYVGDGTSREVIRKYEVYNKGKGRRYKMNVLLTTYEVVLKDSSFMRSIQWVYLMVDEAHRLKNNESSLYRELSSFHCKTRLLVTGTPLQNNVKELWALLHFLHPKQFNSCEDFQETHNMHEEEGLKHLHKDLMPHLLRRTIKDVEKSLPPKTERILRVEMSPLQRKYYKLILKRNFEELNKGVKGSGHVSLLNIVVELKKCCNHPFLFESAEEQYLNDQTSASKLLTLVLGSGKLSLLDKLLQRLKESGHRVLIFSQMVRMLSILSEYCKYKGYRYQQLDGSTNAQARHQAMEHFNAPGSEDFIFLLSTRAGGLGINLATADTVVIFDSDWNPQNDLQAMSRAHRIGQKDTVNIYRFVTANSVEEDILERAKQKMVLDQLVIQQMDTSGRTILNSSNKTAKQMFNKDDLAAILKFGAEDLFKEEKTEEKMEEKMEDAAGPEAKNTMDLDAILARAEHVQDKSNSGGAADFLSSFKVADVKTSAGEEDKTFWERLIPEQDRPQKQEEVELYIPRAARMAAPSSYAEEQIAKSAYTEEEPGAKKARKVKAGSRKSKQPSNGKMKVVKNALYSITEWEGGPPAFGQSEAKALVMSLRKFHDLSKVHSDLSQESAFFSEITPEQIKQLYDMLTEGLEKTLQALEQEQQSSVKPEQEQEDGGEELKEKQNGKKQKEKDPTLGFFGNAIRAKDTKNRLLELKVMDEMVGQREDMENFRLGGGMLPRPPVWARKCDWTPKDDAMVLVGMFKHGWGSWDKLLSDSTLSISEKIVASVDLNTKNTAEMHLQHRANSLLRRLREVSSGSRPTRPSRGGGGGGGGPPKVKLKLKPTKPKLLTVADMMADVKPTLAKIRNLQQDESKKFDKEMKVRKMKQYLSRVGTFIDEKSRDLGNKQEEKLWAYAAKKSKLADGIKMKAIFKRLCQETK